MAVSVPVHRGMVRRATYYLSSGKEGGMGVLPVRAQYKASKAWKQCSGAQVLSSAAVRPSAGLTGRRDMAAKEGTYLGRPLLIALKAVRVRLPILATSTVQTIRSR